MEKSSGRSFGHVMPRVDRMLREDAVAVGAGCLRDGGAARLGSGGRPDDDGARPDVQDESAVRAGIDARGAAQARTSGR